eukprot:scaffold3114_cov114-Isochrysis_galbana.AAC.13
MRGDCLDAIDVSRCLETVRGPPGWGQPGLWRSGTGRSGLPEEAAEAAAATRLPGLSGPCMRGAHRDGSSFAPSSSPASPHPFFESGMARGVKACRFDRSCLVSSDSLAGAPLLQTPTRHRRRADGPFCDGSHTTAVPNAGGRRRRRARSTHGRHR